MKKILIVDDEIEICNLLRDEFTSLGWSVQCAQDGKEAHQKVTDTNFDVIVSDIRMPEGGGLEILKYLRATKSLLPAVYLVTGNPDHALEEALSLGARGVIAKPFSLVDLVRLVANT